MRAAVIRFPGSNCDQDCVLALQQLGVDAGFVWHKDTTLEKYDLIVLPGGFSFGDYLRCGAIARFSPIMPAVKDAAANGQLILGICNGFQILTESHLLPGALMRNRDLHFICSDSFLRVESSSSPLTAHCAEGDILQIPIAHGEGCFVAEDATLDELEANDQVLFRYTDAAGDVSTSTNVNGSSRNIAGICNAGRNVFGMMPHPERACEARLGSTDGVQLFKSLLEHAGTAV